MKIRVEVLNKQQSLSFFPQIATLIRSIWPAEDSSETIDDYVKLLLKYNKDEFERHTLVFDENAVVGYGRIFRRAIIAANKINNMGLSSVCVERNHRGSGLGRMIIENAFGFVDCGNFQCTLFQTKVPEFYRKLGARIISNEVINSLDSRKRPFNDTFIMLYPDHFSVGSGRIDLNGDGY